MTWPPTIPPNTRTDATPQAGAHADDHNVIADALQAVVDTGLPALIQRGTVTVDPGDPFATAVVTFPQPFAAEPMIFTQVHSSSQAWASWTGAEDETQFTLYAVRIDTFNATIQRQVDWIAFGTPA